MAYTGGYATGYQDGEVIIPITTGGATYHARAAGYGARIGDYWVRLAPSRDAPLRTFTQDSLAPRHDDRSSTDENVLELGHQFSRSDLTGGAGLDYYPRPLLQDRAVEDNVRFWDSMNVDIGRTRLASEYAWRLHRKLEEWDNPGNATHMLRTSDLLYIAAGEFVYWYNTLANTTPEDSFDLNETVDAMCAVGDDVYVLANNVIKRKLSGSDQFLTWHTPAGGETIEHIWAAKNRVMAHRTTSSTSELLDMADGTTEVPIDSFEPNVSVNVVLDAGPIILVALDSGIFYSYSFDDGATPDLTPVSQTPLPLGENPISVAYNQGTLLYMTIDPSTTGSSTVARLYAAEVLDSRFNNTIGNSQLIMEWDSSITAIRAQTSDLIPLRDDIWWVMYEADVSGDSYVSMYRYDLVTRGYNRAHAVEVTGPTDPGELVVFEDRLVFINDDDVWVESDDTYADVGWLIGPLYNAGLNTAINWVATVVDTVEVESGALQVELLRTVEEAGLLDWQHSSWISEQRITSPYQDGVEVLMVGTKSKQLALQARIYPSPSGTPGVRKFALRGLPAHRDLIVELPVNISDLIEVPYRAPKVADRWGDTVHTQLFNFQGKHLEVEVLDPPMILVGIVDQIAEPVEYLTARGSQGRMCMVRVRGQQVLADTVTVGTAGLGVAYLGIGTMGIGELTERS